MKTPGDCLYRVPGQPVRHPGRAAVICLVLALVVVLVSLVGCAGGPGSGPTGPSSGDPREDHVLAETARFASMLNVKVRGVVTDEVYLVPAIRPLFPGEKVPASGWYKDGTAYYWRTHLLKNNLEYGSKIAAHEVSHALFHSEEGANACAAVLLEGRSCR